MCIYIYMLTYFYVYIYIYLFIYTQTEMFEGDFIRIPRFFPEICCIDHLLQLISRDEDKPLNLEGQSVWKPSN